MRQPSLRSPAARSARFLAGACHALAAALVMAGTALPAQAQELSQQPPLRVAQAMPFAGGEPAVPATGISPSRVNPPVAGAPANGDPHTILPQPPPGKAAIGMSVRFGEKEPLIARGLVWRVFADRAEASGAYPLVAEAAEPAPVFFLSPGGYVVHVSYGLASVARRIVVGDESRREQLILAAGAIKLHSDAGDKPLPPEKVTYDIYEGSFLQGRASTRPIFRDANPGDLVILPAGDYYVVSTYGDGNATIQADLSVVPGKVTDATLHQRAAEVTLRLVAAAGGQPLNDTQWSVLTPGGDSIKESSETLATFALTEGDYIGVARYEGKTYSKEFTVEAGKDAPVEIVLGEQAAPATLNEGSGD